MVRQVNKSACLHPKRSGWCPGLPGCGNAPAPVVDISPVSDWANVYGRRCHRARTDVQDHGGRTEIGVLQGLGCRLRRVLPGWSCGLRRVMVVGLALPMAVHHAPGTMFVNQRAVVVGRGKERESRKNPKRQQDHDQENNVGEVSAARTRPGPTKHRGHGKGSTGDKFQGHASLDGAHVVFMRGGLVFPLCRGGTGRAR